jgi:hypothetical protein
MRVWMWYARVSMLDAEDIIKQQRTLLVHDLSKLVLTLNQLHLCHTRISLASNTHHDLGTNQDHVKHVRSTAWRCTKPAHLVHDCHLWLGNCSGPFQHGQCPCNGCQHRQDWIGGSVFHSALACREAAPGTVEWIDVVRSVQRSGRQDVLRLIVSFPLTSSASLLYYSHDPRYHIADTV